MTALRFWYFNVAAGHVDCDGLACVYSTFFSSTTAVAAVVVMGTGWRKCKRERGENIPENKDRPMEIVLWRIIHDELEKMTRGRCHGWSYSFYSSRTGKFGGGAWKRKEKRMKIDGAMTRDHESFTTAFYFISSRRDSRFDSLLTLLSLSPLLGYRKRLQGKVQRIHFPGNSTALSLPPLFSPLI